MMASILVALIVGVVAFLAIMFLFSKSAKKDGEEHTKHALEQLMEETQAVEQELQASGSIIRTDLLDSPALRMISALPGGERVAALILRAGFEQQVSTIILLFFILLFGLLFVAGQVGGGIVGHLIAIFLSGFILIKYLEGRVKKRNSQFIDVFPDVLDMIVRGVRSGFPLNTALKMVAENMEPPISTEFKQVIDEISFGRSMSEALERLAQRIDEPDVQFFVVVLNVQHETGGNLAEIISNLSHIIRKRKQIRLKIRAMTSEGRATGWILGMLPVFIFCVLYFIAPGHLEPLFNTDSGHMVLGTSAGLILLTFWIIRQMVDIDI